MLKGFKFQEIKFHNIPFFRKIKQRVYIPFSKVYIPPTKTEVKFSQNDGNGFLRKHTKIHTIPSRHVAVCASTYPCKRIGPLIFFDDDKDYENLEKQSVLLTKKDIDKTVLLRPDIKESYLSKKISSLTNDIFRKELEDFEKEHKVTDAVFDTLSVNLMDELVFFPFYEVRDIIGNVSYVNAFSHSSQNRKSHKHQYSKSFSESMNIYHKITNFFDGTKITRSQYAVGWLSSTAIMYISFPTHFFGFAFFIMLIYSTPLFFQNAFHSPDELGSSCKNKDNDDYLTENQNVINKHSINSSEMIDLVDEFNLRGVFKFNQLSGTNDISVLCNLFGLGLPFTKDQLKTSYLALIKKYHPDNPSNTDKESSNHTTQLINDSYKILQGHCR